MKCIYCKSSNTKIKKTYEECLNCLSYLSLVPEIIYKQGYHAYKFSWIRPKIYYLLLKALKCGLKPSLTIADIGCGAGHSLFWARRFKCKTIGWDISKDIIPEGHHRYDSLDLLSIEQKNSCDIVWCWHTIEHAKNPIKILETCYKILKPSGILYLEFPESISLSCEYPNDINKYASFGEHVGIPSTNWIIKEAQKIGFKILKIEKPREGRWMYLYQTKNFHVRVMLQK